MTTRAECAEGIRELTRWAAAARVQDLPRPVLQRAVRVLADGRRACAFAMRLCGAG